MSRSKEGRGETTEDDDPEAVDATPMLKGAGAPSSRSSFLNSKLWILVVCMLVLCWLTIRTAFSSIEASSHSTQLGSWMVTSGSSSSSYHEPRATYTKKEVPGAVATHTKEEVPGAVATTNATVTDEIFRPRKLHIFSFADAARQELCLLAASTARFGYEINMLAWEHSETFADGTTCGDKCKRAANWRHGQERKMYWQENLIGNHETYGIHEDDLILFTDAFDVIIQNNLTLIPELFLRHTNNGRGIVFNSEATCGDSFLLGGEYGDRLRRMSFDVKFNRDGSVRQFNGDIMCKIMAAKSAMHNNVAGPFYGLSSGGFVGDLRSLKQFFVHIKQVREANAEQAQKGRAPRFEGDQIVFQLAYLRYPEVDVYVDSDASIFYVLSYFTKSGDFSKFDPKDGCASDYMADNKPSWLRFGKTVPVFVHFPGDFRGHMSKCASNLLRQAKEAREDFPKVPHFFDFDRQTRHPVTTICSEWGK